MAFSSVNMDSLTRAMQGTAFGAAERCVPFVTNQFSGLTISDGQSAFEDLRQETLDARGQYSSTEDEMDWEPSGPAILFDFNTVRKINPFADTPAVSKPFDPFNGKGTELYSSMFDAKPFNPFEVKREADNSVMSVAKINPFAQPAASTCSLSVDMDIDEWSLTDQKPVKTQRSSNKQRGNNRNGKPGNRGNNKGNNNTTRNSNGGSNGTSHPHKGRRANGPNGAANKRKPAGGPVAMLGNHKVTVPSGPRQDQDGSRRETRPRGKNNNNNNKSSGRRSQGNKNRNQRR